jgi:hypothetical protein
LLMTMTPGHDQRSAFAVGKTLRWRFRPIE